MKRAVWLLALTAFAQDPVDTLEKARDKILAAAPQLPKYVCTETIERSYYSRRERPEEPPSCERILVDRKKGKYKLKPDATDRLRVSVSAAQGREIYSWTGTAPYDHGVEDILQSGPMGTGVLALHWLDIFSNPSVRFRLIEERPATIEYGFRVPVEASRLTVGARGQWLPTGYSGFIYIDKNSLDLRQFTFETDELPPETSMCEESAALEFPNRQAPGATWFVPAKSSAHDVMRDTTETDRVATFSECREVPGTPTAPPPARTAAPLPPDLKVSLVFNAPIDTDVAAAGDPISATVTEPVMIGSAIVLHRGATVAGRIVRMRRQWDPSLFLISLAFETLENNGASSPFYATLIDPEPVKEKALYETMPLTGHGLKDWPQGRFGFFSPKARLVIPASFKSKWLTTPPPSAR
jgi:hypothetical protein